MAEKKRTRLRICELNPHLLCALCGGYLIDATTIVECLHSFCKTCILRYLETSNYCPICEVLIHKKRPWQNIRLDHTLQNAVYKLVPALFKREMQRRRDFYEKNPPPGGKELEQVHVAPERIIFSEDEKFSVSLEFSPNGRAVQVENDKSVATAINKAHHDKRFLLCPANVCIGHLKKFVRLKYTLPQCYQIDLFYADEPLEDTYTLMDVAYIYSWRRENVLTLYYSFYQRPRKRRRVTASATAGTQDNHTASSSHVIKSKAPTASANSTAAATTTTTSTVTIVEASDAGGSTEGEGTKTTVSVSLPSSTALPLALSLPLPRSDASPLNSKTNSLGFDEDEDDDDDERPLIIVTDTPVSATPMEMDMADGESGVTIITHSKTQGSKKSCTGDTTDGNVGRSSSAPDRDLPSVSSSITPSPSSSTVSSSVCSSTVDAANIPVSNCSSSDDTGTVSVLPSSSSAHPVICGETASSSVSSCSTQPVSTTDHASPVDADSSEPARPSENLCPNISQRQTDFPKHVEKSSCLNQQAVAEQTLKRPRSVESSCPAGKTPRRDLPQRSPLRASKDVESLALGSCPPEVDQQTQCADSAREAGHEKQPAPSAALPAEKTCDTECSRPSDAGPVEDKAAETSLPAESVQLTESVETTEAVLQIEVCVPGEQTSSETFPSERNVSKSFTKPSPPSEGCQSKGLSRPKDLLKPREHSQSAESSGPRESAAGQTDTSKGQNNSQGENSKTEGRSVSSAKGSLSESSASSGRSNSNSSSPGLFERIYTVTSNCSASGIKSIFKTTAIVPAAAASRRYSDVSGTSPAAGMGERRASTGGAGSGAKRHSDKDKPKASIHKHKAAASRDSRSSLDALAHLTKTSDFSSPHGSNTSSPKTGSAGPDPSKSSLGLPSGTVPSKTSDKRQNVKNDNGFVSSKESYNSSANGSCLTKHSVSVPSTASSPKAPVNTLSNSSMKTAVTTAQSVQAVNSANSKAISSDRIAVSSPSSASKAEAKTVNALITGDLRVRLPKCPVAHERLSTAIDQLKQRHIDSANMGTAKKLSHESAVSGQTSNTSSHTSSASSPSKALPNNGVKLIPASGAKSGEDDRRNEVKTSATDKGTGNDTASQKKSSASASQSNSSVKKENQAGGQVEKRTASISSVAHTAYSSGSSGINTVASSKTSGPEAFAEKRPEVSHASSKTVGVVSGSEGGRAEAVVSTAGVKRTHSSTAASPAIAPSPKLSATITTTNTHARLLAATKLVTTSPDVKVQALPSSHMRASCANYGTEGPEAKRLKLSGSSQFSMSPHVTHTILSSSSVATSGGGVHRPDGVNGSSAATSAVSSVSSSKTVYCLNRTNSAGMAKVRPSGNHAASGNKLLAPGQRVDSLLFKATSRMAAAAAAASRLHSGNSLSAGAVEEKKVQSEKKIRLESVDSRMSFINKTFGGGRSSKETCVGPAAGRAEINFSARHILSPMFSVSRPSVIPAAPRKCSQAGAMTSPRTNAGVSSPKSTPGVRDFSRKSGSSDGVKDTKSTKEGSGSDCSSRGGLETMKLDIPRLSTSSRDSVFASDPESSPTPSPKYSDINRNPIKLEPGSKLCRRETWVSAENGGRRSTGSVGSPNSLGSGPGSPLETERSPARDARRPSDSDLLLSQRWHGLHPHPHLLAIPHPRDPATVAAVAALYNGHFKVPPAAKYLPLAPDHVPRSISPDPMPLDYSTSSSSGSSK